MNPRTVFTKTADIGSLRVGWLRSSQRRSLHEVNSHSETNLPTNILTKLSAAVVACGFGASMMVQAGTHDHSGQSTRYAQRRRMRSTNIFLRPRGTFILSIRTLSPKRNRALPHKCTVKYYETTATLSAGCVVFLTK
jgi:hypothetical protein